MPSVLPAHLKRLEAESIHIMREVVAEMRNPVMLYSIGKDSSVMLHVAMKAFYPAKPPFPLLHVDTTWKFREMIAFRDETARRLGLDLIVHINQDGVKRGISPIASGSQLHTQVMKTESLRQALDSGRFDAAFGGARRDEEKSRAKERIFSFRSAAHAWDPRNQRPELWRLFNTRIREGESMRVFPLSNWTELDVWEYVLAEDIPVVPLYFAKLRPVVERSGALIMVDDERLPLMPGEQPTMRRVRFRTLGCYPLTGAIESEADTLRDIIAEMRKATTSERQGRLIDSDEASSMEKKKREGVLLMNVAVDLGGSYPTLRLLTCGSVDDGKSTLIGRMLYEKKLIFDDQLSTLERDFEKVRHDRRGRSTTRCSSTGSRPNANRASRSTSPIAISPPKSARSSSPIRRAMSNSPATWRLARPTPISRSCWSTRARGCSRRRIAIRSSFRCSASAMSCLRSTRSTSSTTARACFARLKPTTGNSPRRSASAR